MSGHTVDTNARRPGRCAAYYATSISDFLLADDDAVHGALARPRGFALTPEQLGAWRSQLPVLRRALQGVAGWLYLEFDIPRLGRRVDAVVVTEIAVVPIEFKVGASEYARADYEQAWDYGLDLKNFHAPSHRAEIYPILCATAADTGDRRWKPAYDDGVRPPFRCNAASLREGLRLALDRESTPVLEPATWGDGRYSPTPTIIEAARSLYASHSVHDITRNDAGAINLEVTSRVVESVIEDARRRMRKAIVFVTGVPGAGKTLVGLNVATRHGASGDATNAVFLSGNGPLVEVLREALARDEFLRLKAIDSKARIGVSRNAVRAFIQNVHHFRDDALRTDDAPCDHVVVFDEAQRAWDAHMLGKFMRQKRGRPGFTQSEPDLLIGAMDRHRWAVIVCLVGGGQEINTGEAGISAWFDGIRSRFPAWDVHVSPNLCTSEFAAAESVRLLASSRAGDASCVLEPSLHLAMSMRSFRAELVSSFVKALLDGDEEDARGLLQQVQSKYPIVLVRSMSAARRWIRQHRRGTERAGLLASSSAQRLKPHAVDVRVGIDPVHWFLQPSNDTRSSQYLEDAATEFQVQGLELDWTIVAWDADLRWRSDGWGYHNFRGNCWTDIKKPERHQYLRNAYRVLLTRARQGMVLFVPPGRRRDLTRLPSFYDGTATYLRSLGIPVVS